VSRFWLAILLASIPIKMGKIFSSPVYVQEYIAEHGFPPGALPVANIILTDLPFFALLALCVLTIAREGGRRRGHRVGVAGLVVVLWAGLSCTKAVLMDAALWELVRLTQYLLFYYLAVYFVRSRAELRTIVYVTAAMLAFQGVYCVGQFFFDLNTLLFGADATTSSNISYSGAGAGQAAEGGVLGGRRRGGGTVGHANVTAQYFEFWLPYLIAVGLTARKRFVQILMWLAAGSTIVGLAFTFSRGGALAVGFGLACTLIALLHSGRVERRFARGALALVLLAGVLLAPAAYFYMTTRPKMFEDRFWLARVAISMTASNPVLGVGLNQSMERFYEFDAEKRGVRERIHLYYLAMMAERGIPGVAFFMLFYGLALREAWRNTRARDPAAGVISAAAFGALSAGALHMTFDLFFGMPSQWSMWLNAGIAVACGRIPPEAEPDALAEGVPAEGPGEPEPEAPR
jgi:O-antigen ligase